MNHTPLKEKILQEIRTGRVRMTPRVVYALKVAALALTGSAVVGLTIFIVNIISFILRISSQEVLLGFGGSGVLAFLMHFPWGLALLDGLLVVLFQWLFRKFSIGYTTPVVYVVLAVVVGAGIVGFSIDRATPFNDRVFEGRAHLPPPVRGLYEDAHRPPQRGSGVCRCTVLSVSDTGLIVEDTENGTSTLTVMLPRGNRHMPTTGIEVGDVLLIAGREDDGVLRAFGIIKLDK